MRAFAIFAVFVLGGCEATQGVLQVNDATDGGDSDGTVEAEGTAEDAPGDLPWESEACTRAFVYTFDAWEHDPNSGWLEGQWDAGDWGTGALEASWRWDDRYGGWFQGRFSGDDGSEGALDGYMYRNDYGGIELNGTAYGADRQAILRATRPADAIEGSGEGWFSFAEAWIKAEGKGDEEGEFEGEFLLDGSAPGNAEGEWGTWPNSSGWGGWFRAELESPSWDEELNGYWYPYEQDHDDLYGWEGELPGWGAFRGEIVGGHDGKRKIEGAGFPFGCH